MKDFQKQIKYSKPGGLVRKKKIPEERLGATLG
jgi:hypothetical protein